MSTIPTVTRGDKFVRTARIDADKPLAGAQIRMVLGRRVDGPAIVELMVGAGIEVIGKLLV